MPKSEHTPGPWGYVYHRGLRQHLVGPVLENVAIVEDRFKNAVANARLIHASPDLYTAAKCALWSLEATGRDVCDDGTPTKPARLLREAIKKVEG